MVGWPGWSSLFIFAQLLIFVKNVRCYFQSFDIIAAVSKFISHCCTQCPVTFVRLVHCVILLSHMAGLQKHVKSSTVFVFLFVNVSAVSTQPLCSAEIAITETNLIFCVAVIFRITQWSGCRQT